MIEATKRNAMQQVLAQWYEVPLTTQTKTTAGTFGPEALWAETLCVTATITHDKNLFRPAHPTLKQSKIAYI